MTEIDFAEFVRMICKRPKMYTATGAFYELVSYLDGYGKSAEVGESASHMFFTPFLNWVVLKFDLKEKQGIFGWVQFRELFDSDSDALNELPILYNEFLERRQ